LAHSTNSRSVLGRVAATGLHAHGLVDHHEASGQQAHPADARGVGFELLLHAGRHVGALRQELLHHLR
jgi:hypothetical protein